MGNAHLKEIQAANETGKIEYSEKGITHLPTYFVERLKDITKLDVSSNPGIRLNLSSWPQAMTCKLTYVDFSSTQLLFFPVELCPVITIQTLKLSFNSIDSIPEDIGNMINLESLQLYNNLLTILPKSLKKLPLARCK